MKNILSFLFIIVILFAGCKSSEKLLQQGNYNEAFHKAFKKVASNPNDSKQLSVLKRSFKLANQQNLNAIQEMQSQGYPALEPKIYKNYLALYQRQNILQRLPGHTLKRIGFHYIDYNNELQKSKRAAANYFHSEALALLNTHDIYNARKAFYLLKNEAQLYPATPGLRNLMAEARNAGTIHVIFEVQNMSGQEIPPDLMDKLYQLNPNVINGNWVVFDTYPVQNRNYQYLVKLDINSIQISPQQVDRNTFVEKKKIADGWQYVLDRNGNVKKDSSGNDIKIPRYKIIKAKVTMVTLTQESRVLGTVGIYNNATGNPVTVQNLQSHFNFRYRYALAQGNLNALDKQTREWVSRGPVPFPDYAQLLFENFRIIKDKTQYFLSANRSLFR